MGSIGLGHFVDATSRFLRKNTYFQGQDIVNMTNDKWTWDLSYY